MRRGATRPPWLNAARPPMPLARIASPSRTSTVTASRAAAISSARLARSSGRIELAGVSCRSRAAVGRLGVDPGGLDRPGELLAREHGQRSERRLVVVLFGVALELVEAVGAED